MKAFRVTVFAAPEARDRADTAAERGDVKDGTQKDEYTHTCEACWASENSMTSEEARRDIKGTRTQKQIARATSWAYAKEHVQMTFEFLGIETESKKAGKKRLRTEVTMHINTLADIFGPMMHILDLKDQDMRKAHVAAQRMQAWLDGNPIPSGSSVSEGQGDEEIGAALEHELVETSWKTRAFENKGELQTKFYRAADYTDEWFSDGGKAFRAYYICLAGPSEHPCGTAIRSDLWDRFHEDALASGQRWYCKVCTARYKVKWGVLCEIVHPDRCLYTLAEFPPHAHYVISRLTQLRMFA